MESRVTEGIDETLPFAKNHKTELKAEVRAGELASSPCLGSSSPCKFRVQLPMNH